MRRLRVLRLRQNLIWRELVILNRLSSLLRFLHWLLDWSSKLNRHRLHRFHLGRHWCNVQETSQSQDAAEPELNTGFTHPLWNHRRTMYKRPCSLLEERPKFLCRAELDVFLCGLRTHFHRGVALEGCWDGHLANVTYQRKGSRIQTHPISADRARYIARILLKLQACRSGSLACMRGSGASSRRKA